ncbi:hypothetical protein D9611_006175 [Ephemerocybe angulata]|uniref:PCI domain-containing protein n=1 Tax=Ephemerocybe angulata TaxID=980116 RepID=A0A8H5FGT2_9AGAR|nr:hypothetical protein D9611_006175 [Tulosesus angulatus]
MDWYQCTVVGTSQHLFKDYVHLNSEPHPSTVRPYGVLLQTFEALKKRDWEDEDSCRWIYNQLKSIKQDLRLQRLANEFTVKVFETHARMALQFDDMAEYEQCQITLDSLYALGIQGKEEEFIAYKILSMVRRNYSESDLNVHPGRLTPQQKADTAIRHALDVQKALEGGDYHAFFNLYDDAPNMGGFIMDSFLERERTKALLIITETYRHEVPLPFLTKELAFENEEETIEFLVKHDANTFKIQHPDAKEKILVCKPAYGRMLQKACERSRMMRGSSSKGKERA